MLEGVLFIDGLAAVWPVQPRTADPKASTHLNTGLAVFRQAQKTAEPRIRVPRWHGKRCTRGVSDWTSSSGPALRRRRFIVSSSLRRGVVVLRLDVFFVPPNLIEPEASSSSQLGAVRFSSASNLD